MGKNMRGFAAGFAAGASIGRSLAKDWKEASLQSDLGDASQSNGVTEQVSGDAAKANIEQNFVPQEGGPQTAAEFIQQTPGVADVVAKQEAGFTTGGKSYASQEAAGAAARGLNVKAMSETYAKHGRPEDAARLELQGLQLKNAERQDRAGQEDEEYQASRKSLSEQFTGNRMYVENKAASDKYNADMATYQEALKKNPDNPAAAGMAPPKPTLRAMTGLDMLHDANLLMQHDMKYGKVDPDKALRYQKLVGDVKKEVGTEAFKLLHAGDVQGAVKSFEAQGDIRLPEGAQVEARKGFYEVGGQKVPTHELVVKLPDGKVQVINGLQGMDALDAADKIISNNFRGAELGMSKQRLGIAQAGEARERERFESTAPAREAVKTLGVLQLGLANESDPETRKVIQGKINDLKSISAKSAPHVSKVIYGDDNSASMVMSDGTVKPMVDNEGIPIKKGDDKRLQVSLAKVLAEGVTDETRLNESMSQAGNILTGKSPAKAKSSSFASEADVGAALKAGTIKKGDTVEVGGKKFRID